MIDCPALTIRCRLPHGALGLLVTLHRLGADDVKIWLLDGLAPTAHARGTFLARNSGSIRSSIARVLTLFPPAHGGSVVTMAPDESDRPLFPAEAVRRRYESLVHSFPLWRGETIVAAPRNDWYRELVQSDDPPAEIARGVRPAAPVHLFFVHEDETPYGNIAFRVNPAASAVLRSLPPYLPAALFDILSAAGHSERIAIIPASSPLLGSPAGATSLPGRLPLYRTAPGTTVVDIAAALSRLWVPDRHVQAEWDVPTRPLGVWSPGGRASKLVTTLSPAWQDSGAMEELECEAFLRILSGHRTLAGIVANDARDQSEFCETHLLFVNGVSGSTGGF